VFVTPCFLFVKEGAIFCFFFLVGGPQGAYSARGGGSKEVLVLGSAQCSKTIGDGPINMAPSKKTKNKTKCEHTHELINMNHNTYPMI